MGRIERSPNIVSTFRALDRRITLAERGVGKASTQLLTGLSVTAIGTTAKTIASFEFVIVEAGFVEVFATFEAQMSGSNRSVAVSAPIDGGTGAQILNFTSTSSTRLFTQHGTNAGTTDLGGFVVRHWNVSAGRHTIDFKATGSGTGVNESITSGQIAYRVIG